MARKQACTRKRPCPACGMKRPASGDDPCIENLPGVRFACCGHGQSEGYISFEDGRVIRFRMVAIERACKRLPLTPDGHLDVDKFFIMRSADHWSRKHEHEILVE